MARTSPTSGWLGVGGVAFPTILFLGSLPASNVRVAGITPPLAFGALLILIALARSLGRRIVIDGFDLAVGLFIAIAATKLSLENSTFVLLKTVLYSLTYFALKNELIRSENPGRTIFFGAAVGIVVHFAILTVGAVLAGLGAADFLSFSYQRVTQPIYRALYDQTTETGEFGGELVMRNTIGESLALYAVCMAALDKTRWMIAASIGGFALQSRRAMAAIVVAVGAYSISSVFRIAGAVLAVAVVTYIYLTSPGLEIENRLASLEAGARTEQYLIVLRADATDLWGKGYGAQIYEKYVHNFWLAAYYMGGLIMLLAAFLVSVMLIFKALPLSRWSILVLIPLFGMAISATVEGMLTLNGWAAIAILSCVSHRRLAQGSQAMISAKGR